MDGWLALKTTNEWMLFPKYDSLQPSRGYDSLKLINMSTAYAEKGGLRQLIFSNGDSLKLSSNENVQTFSGQQYYLLLEKSSEKKVISTMGGEILIGNFNEITFFNDSLIKVKINNKFGLVQVKGGYLIKPEFEAIDEHDGLILCLRKAKIGCYDLRNQVWIHTKYESRIERLGRNYLVKEGGMFGVLNEANELVIPASYEEIKYWNDTSFLVKKENDWRFINHLEDQIGESFEYLSEISDANNESIYEYVKYGKYGLLSSKKGFLLEPEFSEIVNIGGINDPLFFADQNLKTAGFHVVSYVDQSGKLIMSKAYKKEEFNKILCED